MEEGNGFGNGADAVGDFEGVVFYIKMVGGGVIECCWTFDSVT